MSKIKSPKVKIGDTEEEIKPPVNPNGYNGPSNEEIIAKEVSEVKQELEEVKEEIKEEEQKVEEEIEEIKEEVKPEESATEEKQEEPVVAPAVEEPPKVEVNNTEEVKEEKTEIEELEEEAPKVELEEPPVDEAPKVETLEEAPTPEIPEEAPKVEQEETLEETEIIEEAPKVDLAPEPAPVVEEEAPKVEQETAEPPKEASQTLVDITPHAEPPEPTKEEVSVSVQEAIPLEQGSNFEITGASPNDIVAKPVIDIATLESQNPVEETKTEPEPAPVEQVVETPTVEEPMGPLTTIPGSPQIDISQNVGQAPTLQTPNIVPQQQVLQPLQPPVEQQNMMVPQTPPGALGVVGQGMQQPNMMMGQQQGFVNPQGFMGAPNQMNMQMNNMNYNMGGPMQMMPNLMAPDPNYQPYQAQQMMPQNQYYG